MSKETPCSCRGGKRPVTQNGRTVYVDCSRCSGTGVLISYYNAACRYCGGRGVRGTETVYNTCHSCNGNGKISSEWAIPKIWQVLDEKEEIYNAADMFIEAADWIVWQLCGNVTRNSCTAVRIRRRQYEPGQAC